MLIETTVAFKLSYPISFALKNTARVCLCDCDRNDCVPKVQLLGKLPLDGEHRQTT